mmetsp:Transcript_11800/g.34641  ORF Transcript_11800/g.34641 Transcript_11800/m.34641 type:complete len:226 (-) Transcript_11800:375-1052(-)
MLRASVDLRSWSGLLAMVLIRRVYVTVSGSNSASSYSSSASMVISPTRRHARSAASGSEDLERALRQELYDTAEGRTSSFPSSRKRRHMVLSSASALRGASRSPDLAQASMAELNATSVGRVDRSSGPPPCCSWNCWSLCRSSSALSADPLLRLLAHASMTAPHVTLFGLTFRSPCSSYNCIMRRRSASARSAALRSPDRDHADIAEVYPMVLGRTASSPVVSWR